MAKPPCTVPSGLRTASLGAPTNATRPSSTSVSAKPSVLWIGAGAELPSRIACSRSSPDGPVTSATLLLAHREDRLPVEARRERRMVGLDVLAGAGDELVVVLAAHDVPALEIGRAHV